MTKCLTLVVSTATCASNAATVSAASQTATSRPVSARAIANRGTGSGTVVWNVPDCSGVANVGIYVTASAAVAVTT